MAFFEYKQTATIDQENFQMDFGKNREAQWKIFYEINHQIDQMTFYYYEKNFLEQIRDPKKLSKDSVKKIEVQIRDHKLFKNPWIFFYFVLYLSYFKSSYNNRRKFWRFIDCFLKEDNFMLIFDQIEDENVKNFLANF